jgi:hypothetical protein
MSEETMCVASSILRLVLATPREQRTPRNYEIDDFLSRPLYILTLHRDGYSHWVGLIHSTWIQTKHFSFVMAWIRKGLWDSEEPDVALAFALGLLIPRARPAPLSFPGISFPPWEVRCILGITGRSVMFGVLLFVIGMVWLDLGLGFRGLHDGDMDYLCRMHTYCSLGIIGYVDM